MNLVTKVFVMVLVILSLMLAAATTVFVSTAQDSGVKAQQAMDAQQSAEAQLNALKGEAAAARADAASARADVNKKADEMAAEVNRLQATLAERDKALAEAAAKSAIQGLEVAHLTEGLRAATEQNGRLLETTAELRATADELAKKNGDLNSANSALTNSLEVTEAERRLLQEQLVETRAQASAAPSMPGVAAAPPAINGVIRDTRMIQGIPYATISVGSVDSVTKGMTFNVVDRNKGEFLGQFTVDSVEPNEATGRLKGPPGKIEQIRAGAEVRTQL